MSLTATTRLACITMLLSATTTPCLAESFASSASSASSASVGSLSDSIGKSSNASSPDAKVADGDYRVIEIADVAERPGTLRLTLRATAQQGEAGDIWLTLPRQALAQRVLAAGDIVHARHRPYGLEFARADGANGREAFFLVLADDWRRELDPHPVTL